MNEKLEIQNESSGEAVKFDLLVSQPFYDDGQIKIYNGNFESVLPQLDEEVDIIITDPPYPNYYIDEYKYYEGILNFLAAFDCRQLIFWTSKEDFPLDYTSIHIWNKLCGTYATKEFIYERNGDNIECEFNYQKIKNQIDAQMNRDVITGHKSQKPIRLMTEMIAKFTKPNELILDTFMGSGSTLAAAKKLGRRAIGIEINKKWCEVAAKRLAQFELF